MSGLRIGVLMEDEQVEVIARRFHEVYEELAPQHGWDTQERSKVPWETVPHENQGLMRSVVRTLIEEGTIR